MNPLDKDTGNSQPIPSYQSRVASLCTRFPHLSHLSNFLRSNARYPLGRIVRLEFPNNSGSAEPMTATQLTLAELPNLIGPKEGGPVPNQILIVEDLTKEVIEILGSGLSIDPAFFAHHLNSSRIDDMDPSTSQVKALPSVRNREEFVTINFIVPIILDHSPPAKFKCCSNVQRKVGILSPKLSQGLSLARVSRMCSVIRVPRSCGAWLGKAVSALYLGVSPTTCLELKLGIGHRRCPCGSTVNKLVRL
jgi:hypothetical protein